MRLVFLVGSDGEPAVAEDLHPHDDGLRQWRQQEEIFISGLNDFITPFSIIVAQTQQDSVSSSYVTE